MENIGKIEILGSKFMGNEEKEKNFKEEYNVFVVKNSGEMLIQDVEV